MVCGVLLYPFQGQVQHMREKQFLKFVFFSVHPEASYKRQLELTFQAKGKY